MQIQQVDDLAEPLAAEVLRLQLAAYAVEASLIGNDGIPALHETVSDLVAQRLIWLLATDGHALVGAAGYRIGGGRSSNDATSKDTSSPGVEGILDIDRLIVDPNAFRRGIGRALVTRLLAEAGSRAVSVSTGRDNDPARRLYVRSGFGLVDEVEVIPGLFIVRYVYRALTCRAIGEIPVALDGSVRPYGEAGV